MAYKYAGFAIVAILAGCDRTAEAIKPSQPAPTPNASYAETTAYGTYPEQVVPLGDGRAYFVGDNAVWFLSGATATKVVEAGSP